MPPINILIKPASSNCNLHCKYCFYHDVVQNREQKSYGIMKDEILEILVKRVFDYGEGFVGFAFQGGEPTLAGLDFYKTLMELQQKYNVNNLEIYNSIQTNGMVVNEDWAEFFAKNNFLVGLSLDGPKDLHDLNRVDYQGEGSHNRIGKTIELFNKHKVEYNILSVVTRTLARHIHKVYKYYTKQGFKYLQFIPCLDELGTSPGGNPYSLTPRHYGEFLKSLFDLWYKDFMNGQGISIRMFDNMVQILTGYPAESCDMRGVCSANLVVEADGSIYPCDFYVLDEWKMGNIKADGIKEMLEGEKAKAFVEGSLGLPESCEVCRFLPICKGGCRRNYEPFTDKQSGQNYFCSSYKDFYEYTLPRFQEIASIVQRNSRR